jgi:hypothetical protein
LQQYANQHTEHNGNHREFEQRETACAALLRERYS